MAAGSNWSLPWTPFEMIPTSRRVAVVDCPIASGLADAVGPCGHRPSVVAFDLANLCLENFVDGGHGGLLPVNW
jgi:hypothetical protein